MTKWREEHFLTREEALELQRVMRFLRPRCLELQKEIGVILGRLEDIDLRWQRLCYWAGIKPQYNPEAGLPQTEAVMRQKDVDVFITLQESDREDTPHWLKKLWGHGETQSLFYIRLERGPWRLPREVE